MSEKKTVSPERKGSSERGEGLNKAEWGVLQKSTERHDKALKILSKL